MANINRWYYTKVQLANTPSRKCDIDEKRELSYRQQAANFIQDMGQRLQLFQLCINTAIVYMHRFYVYRSFTVVHRNNLSVAAVFLAAKVGEQFRTLEHVIKVAHRCLHKDAPDLDVRSESYAEKAQEVVFHENILLQTLGFVLEIEHPHIYVVKVCQLVKASKELAQSSYLIATTSLLMTTMCIQYKPTVVACVCIYLACKWSSLLIEPCSEGREWFYYVDRTVTLELLEKLTEEFIATLETSPFHFKRKICGKVSATFQNPKAIIENAANEAKEASPSEKSNGLFVKNKEPSPRPSTSLSFDFCPDFDDKHDVMKYDKGPEHNNTSNKKAPEMQSGKKPPVMTVNKKGSEVKVSSIEQKLQDPDKAKTATILLVKQEPDVRLKADINLLHIKNLDDMMKYDKGPDYEHNNTSNKKAPEMQSGKKPCVITVSKKGPEVKVSSIEKKLQDPDKAKKVHLDIDSKKAFCDIDIGKKIQQDMDNEKVQLDMGINRKVLDGDVSRKGPDMEVSKKVHLVDASRKTYPVGANMMKNDKGPDYEHNTSNKKAPELQSGKKPFVMTVSKRGPDVKVSSIEKKLQDTDKAKKVDQDKDSKKTFSGIAIGKKIQLHMDNKKVQSDMGIRRKVLNGDVGRKSPGKKVHLGDTSRKTYPVNANRKIHPNHPVDSDRKIHDVDRKIHSLDAERKIHALGSERKIHVVDTEWKIHPLDTERKIHAVVADRKFHAIDADRRIHTLDSDRKIHVMDADRKIHTMDSDRKIHAMDSDCKVSPTISLVKQEPDERLKTEIDPLHLSHLMSEKRNVLSPIPEPSFEFPLEKKTTVKTESVEINDVRKRFSDSSHSKYKLHEKHKSKHSPCMVKHNNSSEVPPASIKVKIRKDIIPSYQHSIQKTVTSKAKPESPKPSIKIKFPRPLGMATSEPPPKTSTPAMSKLVISKDKSGSGTYSTSHNKRSHTSVDSHYENSYEPPPNKYQKVNHFSHQKDPNKSSRHSSEAQSKTTLHVPSYPNCPDFDGNHNVMKYDKGPDYEHNNTSNKKAPEMQSGKKPYLITVSKKGPEVKVRSIEQKLQDPDKAKTAIVSLVKQEPDVRLKAEINLSHIKNLDNMMTYDKGPDYEHNNTSNKKAPEMQSGKKPCVITLSKKGPEVEVRSIEKKLQDPNLLDYILGKAILQKTVHSEPIKLNCIKQNFAMKLTGALSS